MLNEERQIRHNLLRLAGDFLYPVESDYPVFHVHVCGFHIGNRIPVGLIQRYRRQNCFPPFSSIALCIAITRYIFRVTGSHPSAYLTSLTA